MQLLQFTILEVCYSPDERAGRGPWGLAVGGPMLFELTIHRTSLPPKLAVGIAGDPMANTGTAVDPIFETIYLLAAGRPPSRTISYNGHI
jgi:hypothetical protein